MREINGVPFSKRFLTRTDNRPNRPMTPRYLTIHETGNFDDGATADASTRYMHNGSGGRQASWHVTVDDLEAIQALHWDEQGWHAGDGAGPGNTQSIGMEVCVNLDGAARVKAWDNAARVAAFLVERFDLELRQHNHWSGKNCPHDMRTREYPLSWQDFVAQVQGYREGTPKQEVEMTEDDVKEIVDQQTKTLQRRVTEMGNELERLNTVMVGRERLRHMASDVDRPDEVLNAVESLKEQDYDI